MSVQSKLNALQRENQELKMELTELRNAFDLNRDVLNILSGKSEPSIKHFYIMLKKLNEHIIDLADNQFKARKERYKKIEEVRLSLAQHNDLELKYDAAQHELSELRKKLESVRHQRDRPLGSGDNYVIPPKEAYIMLTEEIRKISNELFVIGNSCTRLKIENAQLRHHVKNGESRLDSGLLKVRVGSVVEMEDEYSDSEPEEDSDPQAFNRTVQYTSHGTSRFNKGHSKGRKRQDTAEERRDNPPAKRVKLLEAELDSKQREIDRLLREKSYCEQKLALLVSTQKRMGQNCKRVNREEQKKRGHQLIDMVQWRFNMEVLDEPQSIRNLEWMPEVRCRSL